MDIIIGTAGHIDHGKTTLVHALTGVDADRLPEEKRRGITIDIGFAELRLEDYRFGFVDVPGHERFVKNMLAGVHGIDLVALIIAADEGVMPQTREHFDICRLLNVKSGLLVITKADTVDAELLDLVREEARELVAGSFLEHAPMVAVSARTGAGLDELKAALVTSAERLPERKEHSIARLPIDRSFSVRGFGAVVTGTLVTGQITEGDELELLPSTHTVRVRGLQVHGDKVTHAVVGQRTAVNLGGIDAAKIERGMTLAQSGRLRPTQIMDAYVTVLADAPRPLRTRARIRIHLGAAEVLGRVRVLDESNEIKPGESGFAQLRLESPTLAVLDERFIIRSYSPSRTIAGGQVLDPLAAKHRGRDLAAARDVMEKLKAGDRVQRLSVFIGLAGDGGSRRSELAARTAWRDVPLDQAIRAAVESGAVVEAEGVYMSNTAFLGLANAARELVQDHHLREPLARGLSRETLREKLFAHITPEVFRAVVTHLIDDGSLTLENQLVRAAGHSVTLAAGDVELRDRLAAIYQTAGLEPPTFDEALARLGGSVNRQHARKLLQLLIDAGEVKLVTGEVFCHRGALDRLAKQLAEYAAQHEPDRLIDVAAFKELTGISRKYAIPLLEYLDRAHLTRRAGDKRMILITGN